jgi:hypothetical protein
MDTLNRTVYGRIFSGSYQQIADAQPSDLIGSLFDKTLMPALVLEPGKQIYHAFSLAQNTSATLPLPENYDSDNRLYIAVRCNLKGRVVFTSPTHGTSTVLLLGTDSDDDGVHAAFWTYQGDMTTFAVSVPSTADGGLTTDFEVFMYEIPDLEDFESYYDKQIGFGVSGD